MIKKGYTVWQVINHISSNVGELDWEDIEKIYDPFLINRSFQADIVLLDKYIIDLNRYSSNIPKEIHYKLMQKCVPKKKRYNKVLKNSKSDAKIKKMALWFGINETLISRYIKKLSPETLKKIKKEMKITEMLNAKQNDIKRGKSR